MKWLQILFWKTVAIIWDYRPSNLPNEYHDRPIAWRWDNEKEDIEYPNHIKILYEWREKGRHWIAFTREAKQINTK